MKYPNCKKEINELTVQYTTSGIAKIREEEILIKQFKTKTDYSDELKYYCPLCNEEIDDIEIEWGE